MLNKCYLWYILLESLRKIWKCKEWPIHLQILFKIKKNAMISNFQNISLHTVHALASMQLCFTDIFYTLYTFNIQTFRHSKRTNFEPRVYLMGSLVITFILPLVSLLVHLSLNISETAHYFFTEISYEA